MWHPKLVRDPWTAEREAELTRLWASGLSASMVATELRITRNAVIGKVHRLGLQGRTTVRQVKERKARSDRGVRRGPRVKREWITGNPRPQRIVQALIVFTRGDTPPDPSEPTKAELRRMLAEAVRNTAALPTES